MEVFLPADQILLQHAIQDHFSVIFKKINFLEPKTQAVSRFLSSHFELAYQNGKHFSSHLLLMNKIISINPKKILKIFVNSLQYV